MGGLSSLLDLESLLEGALSGVDIETIIANGGDISTILNSVLGPIISQIMSTIGWMMLLVSLPSLIYAVANCFFGVRIYRVMITIQTALVSGLLGAGIFAILIRKGWGAILGFFIMAAIGGVLAWFLYMVFLFLQAFNIGVGLGMGIWLLIRIPKLIKDLALVMMGGGSQAAVLTMFKGLVGPGIGIGVVLGITFGVLTVLYTKILIMCATAYKGGKTTARILALIVIIAHGSIAAMNIVNIILALLFIGGGFFVQFYMDKVKPVNIGLKNNNYQPVYNNGYVQSVPYQGGQQMAPQYQQPGQYANPGYGQQIPAPVPMAVEPPKCKLVGLDGIYKGFDFDIDRTTTLGRDVNRCNIIFPDTCAGVSKVQCELKLNPETGAVSIEDKFSSYGTTINGVKLEKGQVKFLNAGDVIMFGENNVFKIEF